MLEVGQQSPKMEYITDQGETKEISTRGVKTWVVFFPFAFTGTCTAEVCDIRDNAQNYESPDTNYVFVTCDPAPSQKAWAAELGFKGAWKSDFYPHGEIAKNFGIFNEELGCANRVSFLVSEDGKIEKVIAADDLGSARDFSQYKE